MFNFFRKKYWLIRGIKNDIDFSDSKPLNFKKFVQSRFSGLWFKEF